MYFLLDPPKILIQIITLFYRKVNILLLVIDIFVTLSKNDRSFCATFQFRPVNSGSVNGTQPFSGAGASGTASELSSASSILPHAPFPAPAHFT